MDVVTAITIACNGAAVDRFHKWRINSRRPLMRNVRTGKQCSIGSAQRVGSALRIGLVFDSSNV